MDTTPPVTPGWEDLGWRASVFRLNSRWYGPSPGNERLTWIGQERIAIGGVPTAAAVRGLTGQGITDVVNCRSGGQVLISQDLAIERAIFGADHVRHAPMRDLGFRQDPRLWAPAARFAAGALGQPGSQVLIHCHQGMRRSAMLAYAVLRLRGHAAGPAASLILDHRRQAQLVPAYVESVEAWLSANALA